MKVVLFCGGLGTRMREHSSTIPKPLAPIGSDPILVHLMRYYAYFGHTEFVCCLGYGGEEIRAFFDAQPELAAGWRLRFVDTGLSSSIVDRLRAVAPLLETDDLFLANYSDGLSDLHLPSYVDAFRMSGAVAGFVATRISQSYHFVSIDGGGLVTAVTPAAEADAWINGGFFIFRRSVFDYLDGADELVSGPFKQLAREGRLYGHKHDGFWAAADTYKDKVNLDRLLESGRAPWEVWK